MIVDDEPVVVQVLRWQLQDFGWNHIVICSESTKALQLIKNLKIAADRNITFDQSCKIDTFGTDAMSDLEKRSEDRVSASRAHQRTPHF